MFVVVIVLLWQIFTLALHVVVTTLAVVEGSDVWCWTSGTLVQVSAAKWRATGICLLFHLVKEAPRIVLFVVCDL